MKIKAGPMLQKYADMVGAEVEEVVEWVSKYVNGPWTYPVESTEQLRLASIKEYIQQMIDSSITTGIKIDLAREAMEKAVVSHKVEECPF